MKRFLSALRDKGINLGKEEVEKLEKYYEMLVEWNEKINLTAITSKQQVYIKHFYDSLAMGFDIHLENQSICDVGSGAGFPAIPIKIAFPHSKVHIVEPIEKRCKFLKEVIKELDLKNIEVFNTRAEAHVENYRSHYDIVTARAVAHLNVILELTLPLVRVGGKMFAYKGSRGIDELKEARDPLEKLGGRVEQVHELMLPNEDHTRINITIYKDNKTPDRFPRPYAQIKNRPLSNEKK